jgi:hypothetical protein
VRAKADAAKDKEHGEEKKGGGKGKGKGRRRQGVSIRRRKPDMPPLLEGQPFYEEVKEYKDQYVFLSACL